ncbi:YrdB family protein [Cellulosimicrobium sp. Marseille-Q4280]|uniref:YrdB family protein n=1 Tax=Cellulosimicrobium sp. Marseille-Q4280 TaxID=2937992 RepID=UPI002041A285|nr:YrdB family protein [Cellulosimicrobium sp. Marseille-Q4280]
MARRTDDAEPGAPRVQHVGPTDVLAFLCEIALVVLLAVAGWRLGTSTGLASPLPVLLGVLLALALPAAAIAVWGRWLAPRAARRLSQPWRLDAHIAVFVASGLVVAAAGLVWWGVGLALVGTTAFALTRAR